MSGSQHDMHIPSDKDSSNFNVVKNFPEGISPCLLFLSSPTYRLVESNADLPIPDDVAEVRLMGDAIGSYVAWPANLIFLNVETAERSKEIGNEVIRQHGSVTSKIQTPKEQQVNKSKVVGTSNATSKKGHAKTKHQKLSPTNGHLLVPTDNHSHVCGAISPNVETAEKSKEIDNEVIRQHGSVTSKKKIQTPKAQQVNKSKVVGPSNATPKKGHAKTKHQKLSPTNGRLPVPTDDHPPVCRAMLCLQSLVDLNLEKTDTCIIPMEESIFGVYYEENIIKDYFNEFLRGEEIGVSMILLTHHFFRGGHWVLVVIDAVSEQVYYLDPLLGDPNSYPNMKMLNTVLQKFRSLRGARVQRSKLNNISWIRIQCPQQRNSINCGYFVMRFMKEIIISNKNEIPMLYFDDFKCSTYSKDKLTEIKEEWSQYVLGLRII
ncbi:hypothetical protein TSUD_292600 [Trifolium subterraneum]|uniref:Ubiquitin-like protease family profile domain-containing protein n=1 Tax=Trifolium subterraneum TaxID=3900 RepID=A0A2Z6N1H4_TRISU|nr:hypothetical protein TSUD_292600 [Trifolium subterraneum]